MLQHETKHSAYADDVNALATVNHENLDVCAVVRLSQLLVTFMHATYASKSEVMLVGTRARLNNPRRMHC